MQEIIFPYDSKWQTIQFKPTAKNIITFNDVNEFQKTQTYKEYLIFLEILQNAIIGKNISQTKEIDKFKIFNTYFNKLEEILKQIQPIQQPMRYGNKAFKDWHLKAVAYTKQFINNILPQKIKGAAEELCRYICESFGSNVRIDYGTGHQLSFMFFCWSLFRLGFCTENELEQLLRQVFYRYIEVMRKIQLRYMLQPAGSHGVWGIDDYHFLPFLLGAAELIGSLELSSPQCIHKPSLIDKYHKEYLYLDCVKFIMEVKKGVSFAESSPILNNISGAASWEKIAKGMPKMYKDQVLGKHPVIKHQYFGTIIPYQ